MDSREHFLQWSEQGDTKTKAELETIKHDPQEIEERFSSDLRFGTGGLRGVLGAGTARMNRYVVRRATRGLAAYLQKSDLPRSVAVSYDSRIDSKLFAEETARTLTACGLDAWLYPRLEPTPALSWAVRRLGCGAGGMITASHNPAEYNGYKVYGPDGCQITDKAAASILAEIQSFGYFDPDLQDQKGRLRQIPEDILDGFLDQELARMSRDLHGLKVVYTPLNGAGLECVTRALQKAGVDDIAIVPQQRQPDGTFPTCPAPNPEDPEAMALGLRLCEEAQADLLLATDPDCDRVGVAAKDGGRYRLISGNQMGVLLLDYLCKTRKLPERPVAFTTIVSTEMASAVADRYGVELKRTLTGFKYIGEQIGLLEQTGETERFLFGFEESYGYLSSPHVRDKDAVNACLLICEMTAHYKEQGQTLWQVWHELEHDSGVYTERLCSFAFPGADGFQRMCGIMEHLRSQAPEQITGVAVDQVIDYKEAEKTGLPASDVLAFHLGDDSHVIIRPSGTEPKMKAYLSCKSDTKTEGIEHIARLENEVREMIKA